MPSHGGGPYGDEEGGNDASQASNFSYGNLSFVESQSKGQGKGNVHGSSSSDARRNQPSSRTGKRDREASSHERNNEEPMSAPEPRISTSHGNQIINDKCEEVDEESTTQGRKIRKSHVFWASRANAAISSDFCLKVSSQEMASMGKISKLGLRHEFKPPRQVQPAQQTESRVRVELESNAQLRGTIFENDSSSQRQRASNAAMGASQRDIENNRYASNDNDRDRDHDRDRDRDRGRGLVQTTINFGAADLPAGQSSSRKFRTSSCFDVGQATDDIEELRGGEVEYSNDGFGPDKEAHRNPFESAAWTMVERRYPSVIEDYSIKAILENRLGNARKVPSLAVVVIKSHYLEEGAMCIVADPTGEMESEVHPKVLSSDEYDFSEGAAIILKDFTVFRAHFNREGYATHSIIITPRNIERVFGAHELTDTQDMRAYEEEHGVRQDGHTRTLPRRRAARNGEEDLEEDEDLVGWLSGNAAEDDREARELRATQNRRMRKLEEILSQQDSIASDPSKERSEETRRKFHVQEQRHTSRRSANSEKDYSQDSVASTRSSQSISNRVVSSTKRARQATSDGDGSCEEGAAQTRTVTEIKTVGSLQEPSTDVKNSQLSQRTSLSDNAGSQETLSPDVDSTSQPYQATKQAEHASLIKDTMRSQNAKTVHTKSDQDLEAQLKELEDSFSSQTSPAVPSAAAAAQQTSISNKEQPQSQDNPKEVDRQNVLEEKGIYTQMSKSGSSAFSQQEDIDMAFTSQTGERSKEAKSNHVTTSSFNDDRWLDDEDDEDDGGFF